MGCSQLPPSYLAANVIELELSNDQAKLVALKDLFVDERYYHFHIVSLVSLIIHLGHKDCIMYIFFRGGQYIYQQSSTSSIKRAFTWFPLTMNLPIRVAARSFRKDSLEAPTHLGLLVPPWTTTTEFITLSKISVLIQTSCPKICWSAIKSDFF